MLRVRVDAEWAALFGDLEDTALIIIDTQRDFLGPAASAPRSAITSIPGTTQFDQRL
jgi:hypothetical protein